MRLVDGLRLASPGAVPRLALVGAGGKTRALFHLGRELLQVPGTSRVLLGACAHLGDWQALWADQHFVVEHATDVLAALQSPHRGLLLFSGPAAGDGRLSGLSQPALAALYDSAQALNLPLLLEADGARQRLIKAPAGHEPAIPPWVDHVVVCAGLPVLGQALDEQMVHRPEVVSLLSGAPMGDILSVSSLSTLLLHPSGGLKNIPPGARRVALLNGANTLEREASGGRLAETLLPTYACALLADLPEAAALASSSALLAAYEPVAGILLAAGASRRYGEPKALLPWRGIPLVRHVAVHALSAGLAPFLVVTGAYAAEIEAALSGLPVQFVPNPAWEGGQGSSVAAGACALPQQAGAAIFLLADQPQVPETLLRSLVAEHRLSLAPLVAPQAGGRRANPVLFDRVTFPALRSLQGELGGRAIFSQYPVRWLPWLDEDILLDVDTPQDYARLLSLE